LNDQKYTNPFADVHNKVKAFKDRLRKANNSDADLRETRLVQEAKEILGKSPSSPANISSPESRSEFPAHGGRPAQQNNLLW
jgi:hypothetical protein